MGNRSNEEQIKWIKENYSSFQSSKEALNEFNKIFNQNITEGTFYSKVSHLNCRLGRFYTIEQEKWIVENANKYKTLSKLAEAYNKKFNSNITSRAISRKACRLGIKTREVHVYTKEEDEWIMQNFQRDTYDKLAVEFNTLFKTCITGKKIRTRCRSLNLKRDDSHVVIDNKKYKIGDEKVNGKYIRVKVKEYERGSGWSDKKANECWTTKQKYVWEQYHKEKVPDDCQIVFLNGNTRDFNIENLYCIKKKYLPYMRNNHWFSDDSNVTLTAIKWCELIYATQE